VRGGEQAPPPLTSLTGGQDLSGELARQWTVTGDDGDARVLLVEQEIERHQQLQLNIDIYGSCLAGNPFDRSRERRESRTAARRSSERRRSSLCERRRRRRIESAMRERLKKGCRP
jgi:hypothetical protein